MSSRDAACRGLIRKAGTTSRHWVIFLALSACCINGVCGALDWFVPATDFPNIDADTSNSGRKFLRSVFRCVLHIHMYMSCVSMCVCIHVHVCFNECVCVRALYVYKIYMQCFSSS